MNRTKKRPFVPSFFILSILIFVFKWIISILFNYPWGKSNLGFTAFILLLLLAACLTLLMLKLFNKKAIITTVCFCIASFFVLDLVMDIAKITLVESKEEWHDDYNPQGITILLQGTGYYLLWGVYFDLLRLAIRKSKI